MTSESSRKPHDGILHYLPQFRDWCFVNKWQLLSISLIIIFAFLIGLAASQKQHYLARDPHHISKYTDSGKLVVEGIVIENLISYPEKNVLIVRCMRIKTDAQYSPVKGDIRLVIPSDLNFNYGDFIRFHSETKEY